MAKAVPTSLAATPGLAPFRTFRLHPQHPPVLLSGEWGSPAPSSAHLGLVCPHDFSTAQAGDTLAHAQHTVSQPREPTNASRGADFQFIQKRGGNRVSGRGG